MLSEGGEITVKRVLSACICQTLHFQLKDGIDPSAAAALVAEEYAAYKLGLDKNGVQYKILNEQTLSDGSITVKLIRQYNQTPVGDYLNME